MYFPRPVEFDPAPYDLPPMLWTLVRAYLAFIGFAVGSFLNVVAWRVPNGMSIVTPGSHCPMCGTPIEARDNLPVIGWLLLKGRCRACRCHIPIRYPLVEAVVGLLTIAVVEHDGPVAVLPFHLVLLWLWTALALIDWDTFTLPLELTLPAIPVAIASAAFDPERTVTEALVGAAVGWSLIVLVGAAAEWWLGKEAMGGGDAWLLASIGGAIGAGGLPVAMFLASLQGSLVGGFQLWRYGRWNPEEEEAPVPPAAAVPAPATEVAPQPVAVETPVAVEPVAAAPTEADAKAAEAPAAVPPSAEPATAAAPAGQDDDDWVPDPSAIPFGPFLVLGGLQAFFLGDWIAQALRWRDVVASLRELVGH